MSTFEKRLSSLKKWQKYEIPFVGLKEGKHDFSYLLDEAFFESFDSKIPGPGELNVALEFNKKSDWFVLSFNISGELIFACDRCTDDFPLEIHDNFRVMLRFEEDDATMDAEDGDVVFISRNDTHFNVAQLLYELSLLSIPLKKIHPEDEDGESGCNEEIMNKWLSQNKDADADTIDPRWEKLKKIKNQ